MSLHEILVEAIKQYLQMRGLTFVRAEAKLRVFVERIPDIYAELNRSIVKQVSRGSWLEIVRECAKEGASELVLEVKLEPVTGKLE